MRLPNGEIIYTDPLNSDTDGDGLKDGEEIIPQFNFVNSSWVGLPSISCGIYFKMKSDPTMRDTDGDGTIDSKDTFPLKNETYISVLKNAYGFSEDEARLIKKLWDIVYKNKKEKMSNKELVHEYFSIISSLCFWYDSTRWHLTANTYSRQTYNNILRLEYGRTEQEILDLTFIINMQHTDVSETTFSEQNVDWNSSKFSYKDNNNYLSTSTEYDKDFAHEAIQYSIFANEDNESIGRLSVDVFCSSFEDGQCYTNYEASFKGDIDSGRWDSGDFASDMDAISCYYLFLNSNSNNIFDIWIDYNFCIQNGTKNMAESFYMALGNGDIKIGKWKLLQILAAETPGSNYIRDDRDNREDIRAFIQFVNNEYGKISS